MFKFVIFLILSSLFLIRQTHCQLSGYIFDYDSDVPVPNVTVSCKNQITISDSTGYFTVLGEPNDTLIFFHVAYQPLKFHLIQEFSEIKIQLLQKKSYIDPVVVNAPFFQRRLVQIPTSFTVIQNKEFEFSNNQDYPDILNLIPGIYVHSGSPSTKRITIRGIGSRIPYGTNRIKAYLNFIPITATDGTSNIEDMDLSLFNRIEIIKGAKSALYNSGLGGIIQMNTPEQFKQGLHGGINSSIGSFGMFRLSSHLTYAKKNLNLSTYYTMLQSEGYRENSSFIKNNILVTARNKSNNKHHLNMLLHITEGKVQIPSSIDLETYQNNPQSAAANWLLVKGHEKYTKINLGLKYQYDITYRISLHSILYTNYLNSFESRPFNILDDNSLRKGVKNYINIKSDLISIQSGIDIMTENYKWKLYETNAGEKGQLQTNYAEDRRNLNAFIHVNYTPSHKLFIESGINLNRTCYTIEDLYSDSLNLSGEFAFKSIWSPFLGLNYQLFNFMYIYSSLSHGFSIPTVEETLLPDGLINPELKPETGINADFGARFTPFNSKLFIDINFYLIGVKNLLVTKRISEEIFMGQNAGSSLHQGIEISSHFLINENYTKKMPSIYIRGTINLTKNKFQHFVDDSMDYSGNFLPGIPENIYTLSTAIKTRNGLYLNTQFRYLSSQFLNDANTEKSDSFFLFNLRTGLNKNLNNSDFRLNIYLGIDNILDERYASMILINAPQFGNNSPRYYYPGIPRNIFIGINLNL